MSNIPDQTIAEDAATAALLLTASSSNSTLVPLTNVVFGGMDGARTITVTPAMTLLEVTDAEEPGAFTRPHPLMLTERPNELW
ncbi:MAG: hypothetical protein Q7S40_11965 [Opitutaceae bacterium]|nr:hypothetical protein [Opitutaceae bacterium]